MGAANLDVYAGDDLPISLACKDGDGNAFDLTGYTVAIKVSWNNGDDTITLDGSDVTVSEAAGTITAALTTTQTSTLPEGRKTKLLLQLTDGDGDLTTIRIGRIRVEKA